MRTPTCRKLKRSSHGLVDEFWLYIHPVILGAGKPVFPDGLELKLTLLDTLTFPCKVVRLRYELSG